MTMYWISVLNIRECLPLLLGILLIEFLNERLCPAEQDGSERVYVCLLYPPAWGLKFNECSVDAVSRQRTEFLNERLQLRAIGVIPAAERVRCGKSRCSHPDNRSSIPLRLTAERETVVERRKLLASIGGIPEKLSTVS